MNASTFKPLTRFGILIVLVFGTLIWAQQDVIVNGIDTSGNIKQLKATTNGELSSNPASQSSGRTSETLVLTTCTAMPSLSGRKSLGLQNCGPNDITCFLSATCGAAGTGISVPAKASGICGFFAMDISSNIAVSCIASTASQLTTAATIVIELGP